MKGKKYLQIAKCSRKDGKPVHNILEHLGTADKLLIRLREVKNG